MQLRIFTSEIFLNNAFKHYKCKLLLLLCTVHWILTNLLILCTFWIICIHLWYRSLHPSPPLWCWSSFPHPLKGLSWSPVGPAWRKRGGVWNIWHSLQGYESSVTYNINWASKETYHCSSEWHSLKSTASKWFIFGHRLCKIILNKHM